MPVLPPVDDQRLVSQRNSVHDVGVSAYALRPGIRDPSAVPRCCRTGALATNRRHTDSHRRHHPPPAKHSRMAVGRLPAPLCSHVFKWLYQSARACPRARRSPRERSPARISRAPCNSSRLAVAHDARLRLRGLPWLCRRGTSLDTRPTVRSSQTVAKVCLQEVDRD